MVLEGQDTIPEMMEAAALEQSIVAKSHPARSGRPSCAKTPGMAISSTPETTPIRAATQVRRARGWEFSSRPTAVVVLER